MVAGDYEAYQRYRQSFCKTLRSFISTIKVFKSLIVIIIFLIGIHHPVGQVFSVVQQSTLGTIIY